MAAAPVGSAWSAVGLMAVVGAAVLAGDLLTKWAAFRSLLVGEVVPVVGGVLNFRLSRNEGAVFGMGQGLGPVFVLVTIVAVAAMVWAVWVYGRGSRILSCALGLLLGGALGNLWDRVAYGHVRDFIDVYAGTRHWPTFNVADVAICVGVGLIVLYSFRHPAEARGGTTDERG